MERRSLYFKLNRIIKRVKREGADDPCLCQEHDAKGASTGIHIAREAIMWAMILLVHTVPVDSLWVMFYFALMSLPRKYYLTVLFAKIEFEFRRETSALFIYSTPRAYFASSFFASFRTAYSLCFAFQFELTKLKHARYEYVS